MWFVLFTEQLIHVGKQQHLGMTRDHLQGEAFINEERMSMTSEDTEQRSSNRRTAYCLKKKDEN
jgi:hypothetical protein